jgi:catechol 2,3-dioxygenase-like lactoylglutathione lyase family enzyme
MVIRIVQWTLDVQDVDVMSAFWSGALGYRVEPGKDGSAMLYPPDDAAPDVPTVYLQPSAGPKRDKLRADLDLDLVAVGRDAEAEVDRLVRLGALHTDVGQAGTEGFVVLADPEGNEFCLLDTPPR